MLEAAGVGMPAVVKGEPLEVVNGEALAVVNVGALGADTGEMLDVVNGGVAGFCSEFTWADSNAS
jgi:hypothetical protein